MHPSLASLDEAIELTRRELGLLDSEDAEGLEASADKRLRLVEEAWEGKEGCDSGEFSRRLLLLRDLQDQVTGKAKTIYGEVRDCLKKRQQANRAIQGYGAKGKRSMFAQVVTRES